MNHKHALLPISDVPQDKVGDIVQSFIDYDNATKVIVEKQSDGNFTIQAYK